MYKKWGCIFKSMAQAESSGNLFPFCHVNFVNGLKGLYPESAARGCPCNHVKIREGGPAFRQRRAWSRGLGELHGREVFKNPVVWSRWSTLAGKAACVLCVLNFQIRICSFMLRYFKSQHLSSRHTFNFPLFFRRSCVSEHFKNKPKPKPKEALAILGDSSGNSCSWVMGCIAQEPESGFSLVGLSGKKHLGMLHTSVGNSQGWF